MERFLPFVFIALQVGLIASVAAVLIFYFKAPYIVAATIIFAWAAFGHLIQADDDMPGEWSNPDGDPTIWRWSIVSLVIKFFFVVLCFWLMYEYPQIREYRWQ